MANSSNQVTSANTMVSEWLTQSIDPNDVIGILAHEIGHVFGLEEAISCGSASVMGGYYRNGTGNMCNIEYPEADPLALVRTNDIAAAEAVVNGSSACTAQVNWNKRDTNIFEGFGTVSAWGTNLQQQTPATNYTWEPENQYLLGANPIYSNQYSAFGISPGDSISVAVTPT